jgi:hypothetical protein
MRRKLERVTLLVLAILLLGGAMPRLLFFVVPQGNLEDWLGNILSSQFIQLLTQLGLAYVHFSSNRTLLILISCVVAVIVIRAIVETMARRRALTYEFQILLILAMVPLQYFSDLSVPLLLCMTLTGVLLHLSSIKQLRWIYRVLAMAIPIGLAILWLDWAEVSALAVFSSLITGGHYLHHDGRLSRAATVCLMLVAIPIFQGLSVWLPT